VEKEFEEGASEMTMKEFGDFVVYGPKGNKMKTSELEGVALNWAVVKIEFPDPDYDDDWRTANIHLEGNEWAFQPSTDWAQGGPIIEREVIGIEPTGTTDEPWLATCTGSDGLENMQTGPTPLIAAMRVFVNSKLGDEVEIPEELK
jgi:hypothetical protein